MSTKKLGDSLDSSARLLGTIVGGVGVLVILGTLYGLFGSDEVWLGLRGGLCGFVTGGALVAEGFRQAHRGVED